MRTYEETRKETLKSREGREEKGLTPQPRKCPLRATPSGDFRDCLGPACAWYIASGCAVLWLALKYEEFVT